MKPEIFLSLRYFLAKKRRASISYISALSIACVAIAVAVLIIVYSTINGMHAGMKSRILSCEAHLELVGYGDDNIDNYEEVVKSLNHLPDVAIAFPFFEGQGLMRYSSSVRGVKIRGVQPEIFRKDKDLAAHFKIKSGKLDFSARNNIVLGDVLAGLMGVKVGDRVTLYVPPKKGSDDFLLPLNIEYKVTAIFSSGFSEYDQFYVFTSLRDAQLLFGVQDVAYGIGVKIKDADQAFYYKRKIRMATKYRFLVSSWMEKRRNMYHALATEKVLVAVVLFFISLMAAFSIASTLIMVVMEKEREIGILKAIGMTPAAVKRIFLTQGLIVGMTGTIIGLFFGLLCSINIDTLLTGLEMVVNFFRKSYYAVFKDIFSVPYPGTWKLFPSDVYYIQSFTAKINWIEVFFICFGSVLLTTLFAFIPARQAAKMKVTDVLHKE